MADDGKIQLEALGEAAAIVLFTTLALPGVEVATGFDDSDKAYPQLTVRCESQGEKPINSGVHKVMFTVGLYAKAEDTIKADYDGWWAQLMGVIYNTGFEASLNAGLFYCYLRSCMRLNVNETFVDEKWTKVVTFTVQAAQLPPL